jgi:hypothetical protein
LLILVLHARNIEKPKNQDCLRDFLQQVATISRWRRSVTGLRKLNMVPRATLAKGAKPRTGLSVIDLRRGDTVHWVPCERVIQELYDVALLDGVARPMALRTDEIRRLITVGPATKKRKQGCKSK